MGSHTKAGLLFVAGCALVGALLFAITNMRFAPAPTNNESAVNLVDVAMENSNAPVEPPPAPADLSAYIGKYPADEVNGIRFMDNPIVRTALIGAMGSDGKLGLFGKFHVEVPIVVANDVLRIHACEAGNCGNGYTILMARDGSSAQVCFQDSGGRGDGRAYWYVDGMLTDRLDDCPDGAAATGNGGTASAAEDAGVPTVSSGEANDSSAQAQ